MAVVYGQIDSLKRLRQILDEKGITRFNSTGDINRFIKNYDRHEQELLFKVERDYDEELNSMIHAKTNLEEEIRAIKTSIELNFKGKIDKLKYRARKADNIETKNPVVEVLYWYKHVLLRVWIMIIKRGEKSKIRRATRELIPKLNKLDKDISALTKNKESTISGRFTKELAQLAYEKRVAGELNPLIAGAIGEHLVANELKTLPEPCVVFNDYKLHFKEPIYNKNEHDRIYSIQIDHLLLTEAGLFIIESKNWSKKSLKRLDLRSPVKQMQRASYALFVILNGNASRLNGVLEPHHWGERELPVRNVVAMINNKPREKFKHVAVKRLDELVGYITHFEPIFKDSEVRRIARYLIDLQGDYN